LSLKSQGCDRFRRVLKFPELCRNAVWQILRLRHRLRTGNSSENTDFLLGNSR
jgi:hypothetical protein